LQSAFDTNMGAKGDRAGRWRAAGSFSWLEAPGFQPLVAALGTFALPPESILDEPPPDW